MRFTVPASTQVTQLGRYKVSGDSKTHTLKLMQLAGNAGTLVGQVTVNMTGAASNGYVYAALASAVTLTAGNTYALGSQEVAGATEDQFLDQTPVTVAAGTATVLNPAYSLDGVSWPPMTAGSSYGPVNMMISGGTSSLLHFREMYQYSTAGLMTGKKLWGETSATAGGSVSTDELAASYTFDNEGRMIGQTYPTAQPVGGGADVTGEVFAYGFDAMGRPTTMTSAAGRRTGLAAWRITTWACRRRSRRRTRRWRERRGLTTCWGS